MAATDAERRAFAEQVRAANRSNPDPVIQATLADDELLDQLRESYAAHQRGERGVPFRQIQAEARARREREGV